ncbi:hypothetical protein bcgnr5372_41080 [Bacillus luti]|nr:hypothetical protein [Bacillus cereus]HDR8334356.1 hypothetical protein [Bacillus cereus]
MKMFFIVFFTAMFLFALCALIGSLFLYISKSDDPKYVEVARVYAVRGAVLMFFSLTGWALSYLHFSEMLSRYIN